jgi:hypothetical protein
MHIIFYLKCKFFKTRKIQCILQFTISKQEKLEVDYCKASLQQVLLKYNHVQDGTFKIKFQETMLR